MLKIEKVSVMNFDNAIRGARNPLNSWSKSDSYYKEVRDPHTGRPGSVFVLGENDLGLASRLARAGSDHRKFLRQIFVSADITAPLYWWKEFDTYKVGTVANSCSTMHRIHAKAFELDDFSYDQMDKESIEMLKTIISFLEDQRLYYLRDTDNRQPWFDIIQLLPTSYNQMRTVTLNYENLISIYYARKGHKLPEWNTFCDRIMELPYAAQLIAVKGDAYRLY